MFKSEPLTHSGSKIENCEILQDLIDEEAKFEHESVAIEGCLCETRNGIFAVECIPVQKPLHLLITLNRFINSSFECNSTTRNISTKITLPYKVGLILEQDTTDRAKRMYYLKGVICHRGVSLNNGHYVKYL